MKDIHVFLLDYSSQTVLNKSLVSLSLISHRLKAVIVFKRQNLSLYINKASNNINIELINMIDNDLGKTLNYCIPTINSDYVLFLYNHEQFTSETNVFSNLSDKYSVLTNSYRVQSFEIERPLLVKADLLKKTKFFTKEQVPFNEAVLPAWLMKIDKSNVLKMNKAMVKSFNPKIDNKSINKMEFISKFTSIPKAPYDSTPTITVMISNYNMDRYLETAVSSCTLQTEPIDQLLVIDDGSTDQSYERLKKWNKEPNFKLFHKENGGKARALNELLPYVTSEFILELDADDWLDPDAISIIKQQVKMLPSTVAVLYGNLRNWRQFDSNEMKFTGVNKGKPVNNESELLSYQFPLGPRIYRTDLLKEIGGFPVIDFEDGKLYEDVLVLKNLIKKGRLFYHDFTIYNVRNHQSSITKENHSKWHDFKKYLD